MRDSLFVVVPCAPVSAGRAMKADMFVFWFRYRIESKCYTHRAWMQERESDPLC